MTKHVLLDFDGTLVDSSEGIYAAFTQSCNECDLIPPDLKIFKRLIGPPIRTLVKLLYPGIPDHILASFLDKFRYEYDNHSCLILSWHQGVVETLKTLSSDSDIDLFIVTNKPTAPTQSIVQNSNLERCFRLIVGIDYPSIARIGSPFTNKQDAIKYTLKTHGADPSKSIYVGDTPGDRDASKAAGLEFIAARYGFYAWADEELSEYTTLTNFRDLLLHIPVNLRN
jgi:phosphoglycolate phosphatase